MASGSMLDLAERKSLARQLLYPWLLLVVVDVFFLRGAGTGIVHAAFSVLHDPATTLTGFVLVPVGVYLLSAVTPTEPISRGWRRSRFLFGSLAVMAIVTAGALSSRSVATHFCESIPYPEDFREPTVRTKLVELQSNYWAGVNAGTLDDMQAAKQDYIATVSAARSTGCSGFADFIRLGSLRAIWAWGLVSIVTVLLCSVVVASLLQFFLRVALTGRQQAGLALAASLLAIYPLLRYYSAWYLSFGTEWSARGDTAMVGILSGSLALFLLARRVAQRRVWVGMALSLAAAGLLGDLLALLWPAGFEHFAMHFATASLSVVLFVELLFAAWIVVTVVLFVESRAD